MRRILPGVAIDGTLEAEPVPLHGSQGRSRADTSHTRLLQSAANERVPATLNHDGVCVRNHGVDGLFGGVVQNETEYAGQRATTKTTSNN